MRCINWDQSLVDYLRSRRHHPFEWGVHDCCRFSCGALVVQGIADPMASVKSYHSRASAARRLSELGGLDNAAEVLLPAVGLREIPLNFAGRGCVVTGEIIGPSGTLELMLGVVDLDGQYALFPGMTELIRVKVRECERAWGFD